MQLFRPCPPCYRNMRLTGPHRRPPRHCRGFCKTPIKKSRGCLIEPIMLFVPRRTRFRRVLPQASSTRISIRVWTCTAMRTTTDDSKVYLGFPSLPFIYFDQVVLPRYEANTKLAHLGPYARQKNMVGTLTPLVAPSSLCRSAPPSPYTALVVGGYTPYCRWYSEDAKLLVDNIRVSTWPWQEPIC